MDIDKILLNVMNNKASKEEYEALESWKNDSQENIALLQQIVANQESTDISYKQYNSEKAWKKINAQIEPSPAISKPKAGKSNIWLLVLIAALIGLGSYFFIGGEKATTNYKSETQTMAFALEDDSKIWLRDGGSTLDIVTDFNTERKVALAGEAFFDISPDKEKPFIIQLANQEYIKVIGTSFNVINRADELDIVIYSGTVEFHMEDRDSPIVLTKGDRVTKINGANVKTKNRDTNMLSWKNNELIFDNTDFSAVLDAISNHYTVDFDLDSKSVNLSNCTVRTKFTTESISQIMAELSDHLGFNYDIIENNIKITDLSCK